MSWGHSQPRIQSRRRTLGKCKEKGKTDNVVFIYVDDDKSNNIISDIPECSRVSREDDKLLSRSIISIDDDGSGGDDSPVKGVDSGAGLDIEATSNEASHPVSTKLPNSEESDDDECQIVCERKFPLKLSKCKWTYSGNKQSRNRFGLNPDSESSSSESDDSDCEFMEGNCGKIREEWEKAYLRRGKKVWDDFWNGQYEVEDRGSVSGSHTDSQEMDVERMDEHTEVSDNSISSNANDDKENLSIPTNPGDSNFGDTSLRPDGDSPVTDSDQNVEQESPGVETLNFHRKDDVNRGKTFPGNPSFGNTEWKSVRVNTNDKEERVPGEPSLWSNKEHGGGQQFNYTGACFQEKEEKVPATTCLFNTQPVYDFNYGEPSFLVEVASWVHTQQLNETKVDHYGVAKDEKIYREPPCNPQSPDNTEYKATCFEDKEKPVSGKSSLCNTQTYDKPQVNYGVVCPNDRDGAVQHETCFRNTQLWDETEVDHERASCQDNDKPVSEEPSLCNAQQVETQANHGIACCKDAEDPILDSLCDPFSKSDVQNDIIGEREKLKKTEEYKRAAEEEWASRRRQLQIQADEAHQLQKRRRAETMRLIDMERRQKQRVEEMREMQKKDEETINLKEQIRVEIREELDKLEVKYNDMASLLRALGIHVGGGVYPTSCAVHAAYKQALLRFHPDRASRTSIHHLVEAEEKFKLISRLKEKFLPVS